MGGLVCLWKSTVSERRHIVIVSCDQTALEGIMMALWEEDTYGPFMGGIHLWPVDLPHQGGSHAELFAASYLRHSDDQVMSRSL